MTCLTSLRRLSVALAAASLLLAATGGPATAQAAFLTGEGLLRVPVTSLRDMPFRTVVRQQFDFSCGSAALATLLRHHYGRQVGEAQVFQAMYARGDQATIRRVGFSLLDMKAYLVAQGLAADGYLVDIDSLQQLSGPAIALIRIGAYRHFVVVKGVRAGEILVGDPALGLKAYRLAEFARVWDGMVLKVHARAAAGTFNRESEWGALRLGPVAPPGAPTQAAMMRELPPLYQITEVRP